MTEPRGINLNVRLSERERDAYAAAAERAGLSTSEWARLVLSHAARCSPIAEQLARVPLAPEARAKR